MNENIQGKVIVITGASSGLGEAAARLLAAQGARVALGARRQDRIQALARELTAAGGQAIAVTTDVTDRAQVQRLVDAAVEAFRRVNVMINNAGLMPQSLLARLAAFVGARVEAARARRMAASEMMAMSDREFADMGITRCDATRVLDPAFVPDRQRADI
jgi:NAD(P)-dependent dehydrogenase (short-subunit alcohol dehydrogenase family)